MEENNQNFNAQNEPFNEPFHPNFNPVAQPTPSVPPVQPMPPVQPQNAQQWQNGQYQQYGQYVYSQPSATNGMAIAALICGILAIVFCWIPYINVVSFVLSIIAIVFGVKGKRKGPGPSNGMAMAGLVCGIIGLSLTIIVGACYIVALCTAFSEAFSYYSPYYSAF